MINTIESKKGYVFALKDKSAVYDNVIYLGIYDSADNYIQVTKEEAEQLMEQVTSNPQNDQPIAMQNYAKC